MIDNIEHLNRLLGLTYSAIQSSLIVLGIHITDEAELATYCRSVITRVKLGKKAKYFINYNKMGQAAIKIVENKELLSPEMEQLMQNNFKDDKN